MRPSPAGRVAGGRERDHRLRARRARREDQLSRRSLDYIRAAPTQHVDAATALAGVDAVDVDEVIPLDDPRPEGSVALSPQHWKLVVDGFTVPAGTTTYKYVDVFANAAFGSVSVTDANALRPPGASWTVPGTVTANAAPRVVACCSATCRCGRTDTNVLVGSGDVIVESVTTP